MASPARRRKTAPHRRTRKLRRDPVKSSLGSLRERWLYGAAIFLLGILLGGGLGAAIAFFGDAANREYVTATVTDSPDQVAELINQSAAAPPPSDAGEQPKNDSPPTTKTEPTIYSEAPTTPVLDPVGKANGDSLQPDAEKPGKTTLDSVKQNTAIPPGAIAVSPRASSGDAQPIAAKSAPAWLSNAVASQVPDNVPAIAIVLDDVGVAPEHAEQAIALPPSVTLSFMTYARDVHSMAERARLAGHELMLHLPMEPIDPTLDPGPNALLVGLDRAELRRRLEWGLNRFEGYVGINNHMGSRFTQDRAGMDIVMAELKQRGLLFLDSRTAAHSVGTELAAAHAVPHVSRDVFLDNEVSPAMVRQQLLVAERMAREKGDAVAIGHPHPATIEAIRDWIAHAQARGIAVVPLSAIMRRRIDVAG